jgi:hypothetical protein
VRTRGGYALVATLAILFVLFTLALALQYLGSTAHNNLMIAQADFEAEVALANQEASDLSGLQGASLDFSVPRTSVNMDGRSTTYDSQRRSDVPSGNRLWQNLPTASFDKNAVDPVKNPTSTAWHRYVEYQPKSTNPELKVYRGNSNYAVLYSAGFPYAAFAPAGDVTLSDALPWGNPPTTKKRDDIKSITDFQSAVKVLLGAGKDISVTNSFPYGEAYVRSPEGKITVNGTGALSFYGRFAYQSKNGELPYADNVLSDISTAYDQLHRVAQSGDKTAFLNTEALLSPQGLLDCIMGFGDVSLTQILQAFITPSVDQAMSFPLPVIPTFSTDVLYTEFTFHLPFPPDTNVVQAAAQKAVTMGQGYIDQQAAKLNAAGSKMLDLGPKITQLNQQFDQKLASAMNAAIGPLNQQLSNAQNAVQNAQSQVDQAQQNLNGLTGDALTAAQAALKTAQDNLASAQAAVSSIQQNIQQQSNDIQTQIQNERTAAEQPLLDAIQAANQQRLEVVNSAADDAKQALQDVADGAIGDLLPIQGLANRALEDANTLIDGENGVPGTTFAAFAILLGQAGSSVITQDIKDILARMTLQFIQYICPGGKLVINVRDPSGFTGAAFNAEIYTGLDLLTDPEELEALWALRHGNLKDAIKEWLQPFLEKIPTNKVRLINFGAPDAPTDELFHFKASSNSINAKGFTSEATWTVPSGRCLRLQGEIEIDGDVWLQRGSTLCVDGNLTVKPPSKKPSDNGQFWNGNVRSWRDIDNPLNPNGRIYLEAGSQLLVSGNLDVEGGSFEFGSVTVTAPVGVQSPITSSILCQGNVTLKYGVTPGMGIDDLLAYAVTASKGNGDLKTAAKVVHTLVTDVAPNLAKILGPFHIRKPYFASMSPTLSLYLIIPAPGPPYPNLMVKIFRALAAVYGIGLDAGLGENLYTQSDWWLFGDGCVPVVPRIELDALGEALMQIRPPVPQVSDAVAFFETQLQGFMDKIATIVIKQVISNCLTQIIAAIADIENLSKWASNAAQVAMDTLHSIVSGGQSLFQQLLDQLQQMFQLPTADQVKQLVMEPVKQMAINIVNQIEAAFETSMLRDCPGILCYAGGTLTIGSKDVKPPVACGMFVAQGDVTINTEKTVGCVISKKGSIVANQLLFNPFFTHASLYVPSGKPDWSLWPAAVVQFQYGILADSKFPALEIGGQLYHVAGEGAAQP